MIELMLHSPVMTSHEVAVYLRLCEPDDDPDTVAKAVRSVHKLVRDSIKDTYDTYDQIVDIYENHHHRVRYTPN